MSHPIKPRARFAPSPTGLLHVGNLRTALFAWLFARQHGGTFVLRIEDTDRARSEARFEDFIYRDLRWFGLDWDEGPDAGGAFGPYRQSERGPIYHEQAERLITLGRAYRCFCAEADLVREAEAARAANIPWKYPGICRGLSAAEAARRTRAGEPSVVRLAVRDGEVAFDDIVHGRTRFSTEVIGDPILLRSDGTPTYNYAVVVDDALMEISHVIRGDDHLSNTPKQVLIYEALERPVPEFAHLSTILGPDQARLSKRHGATSAEQFRQAGYLPEALMNYLALLGWSPGAEGSEVVPPERLVREFRLDRVNKNPAVFDYGKLNFINRQYLRESGRTPEMVAATLRAAGLWPTRGEAAGEWVRVVIDTLLNGVDVVSELPQLLEDVLAFPVADGGEAEDLAADPGALDLIRRFIAALEARPRLGLEEFREVVAELKTATGRKGRALFHPLRVALTARSSGPELDKLIPLVETGAALAVPGIENCRARAAAFLARHGG